MEQYLHQMIERTAQGFPDRIAVCEGSRELTYRELNQLAEQTAHLLKKSQTASHVVGIYLEPSIEYVIGVLAVLKANAIFLPLNVRFPNHRMEAILQKTGTHRFISNGRLKGDLCNRIKEFGLPFRLSQLIQVAEEGVSEEKLSTQCETLSTGCDGFVEDNSPESDSADSCYLIATSGSTGEPKSVLGSHRGLAHFINWEIEAFSLTHRVRASFLSHITFDVSLRDIFVPLVCGGTLCIPDEETKQNPAALYRWLEENHVTLIHIVPTLFRFLTQAIQSVPPGGEILTNLEYVFIAGEALYGNDVINWRTAVGNRPLLVNLYGPTETTLAKLFYRIPTRDILPSEIIPLGRPIPETDVLVIHNGKACQTGEIGEIFIRTPYRSKGYYRDPLKTRLSFVQNPLEPVEEEIVYQTGDFGKWLPDHNLLFIGREDGQIKLQGKRVEMSEIEVLLSQHPEIKLAAVSVKSDTSGNERLVAYIVPKDGKDLKIEALRRYAAEKLPDYMIPALFIFLDALPLTHSGKVDRQNLPEPRMKRQHFEQGYVPPSSFMEEKLVGLWHKVLGFEQVGIHDNFFDLGGSSVLAARLVALIKQDLGIEIPIVKLFQFPRISLLS
jgi:amino acid adenylation domain-containing protein